MTQQPFDRDQCVTDVVQKTEDKALEWGFILAQVGNATTQETVMIVAKMQVNSGSGGRRWGREVN